MKKIYILSLFSLCISLTYAQSGIGTSAPKATLDVALPASFSQGDKAGISVPQLTGDQMDAIITQVAPKSGTLVYCTAASTALGSTIKDTGYWFWNNITNHWEVLKSNTTKFFYAPPFTLITDNTHPDYGHVNLYDEYVNQFQNPKASSVVGGKIPVYSRNALQYYVTWYDNTIFTNVQIDNNGNLTYELIGTAPATPSYINVVFIEKP